LWQEVDGGIIEKSAFGCRRLRDAPFINSDLLFHNVIENTMNQSKRHVHSLLTLQYITFTYASILYLETQGQSGYMARNPFTEELQDDMT